jgi:hypothetical protein
MSREPWCSQHRQPLSDCDPWDRHNHSNRFREDDWQATDGAAKAAGQTTTERIAHGMEAMLGYLRCDRGRCATSGPPVPVAFGDLTGKTPGEWITEAAQQVRQQHPGHEPVTIGTGEQSVALTPGAISFREPAVKP